MILYLLRIGHKQQHMDQPSLDASVQVGGSGMMDRFMAHFVPTKHFYIVSENVLSFITVYPSLNTNLQEDDGPSQKPWIIQ